jgi:hypothetical protein
MATLLPPSGGHADLAGVLKSTPHAVIVADPSQTINQTCAAAREPDLPAVGSARSSAAHLAWKPDWIARSFSTLGKYPTPEPQPGSLQLATGAQVLGEALCEKMSAA